MTSFPAPRGLLGIHQGAGREDHGVHQGPGAKGQSSRLWSKARTWSWAPLNAKNPLTGPRKMDKAGGVEKEEEGDPARNKNSDPLPLPFPSILYSSLIVNLPASQTRN